MKKRSRGRPPIGRWSINATECWWCHRPKYPHHGKDLCRSCYADPKKRKAREEALTAEAKRKKKR